MSDTFETSKDVERLREIYFSDPTKQVQLNPGDTLLSEGHFNDRLFLILEGSLTGYLNDQNNEPFEVFRSRANMFVGVYSFFSDEHITYLTIVAEEPARVAFIDQSAKASREGVFATDFLPVIVHELYLRQLLAQRLTRQRQAAIKTLYEKEKMATLGQLAAGLAHELNNAIGVLDKNTEWLTGAVTDFLRNKNLKSLFLKMVEQGQSLSTASLRERRRKFEKQFNIEAPLAKQLAKTTLSEEEIRELLKENRRELNAISLITEAGIVLHDMEVAASHAAHVVQSVRILGLSSTGQTSPTTIFETINKALALTRTLVKDITLSIQRESEGNIVANPGDLVQLWVNLIKNACESMQLAHTENATLTLAIRDVDNSYEVVVADNGPGIPEDLLKKIFQPNFTTKVSGLSFGLGLGLSIVKRIVNHYKGSIAVQSTPGDTRFIVKLPKQ
jgi:Signal transduction histidine kinase